MKARIATVQVGILNIEGLMTEVGDFYIGIPQVSSLFNVPQKNASRDFKALMGGNLTTLKLHIVGTRVTLQGISLRDFEILVAKLDRKGNVLAQQFRDAIAGMALYQLFCDAFEIKCDAEDRQRELIARMASKEFFWHFSNAIESWYLNRENSSAPKHTYFSNAYDAINAGLFGLKSKQIREELGVKDWEPIRDYFNDRALYRIAEVEELSANLLIDSDGSVKPKQIAEQALAIRNFNVMDFKKKE